MRLRPWIVALIVVVPTTAFAQAPGGSIGLYADPQGISRELEAPLFVPNDTYLLATPETSTTFGGLVGAEFRVKGLPASGLLANVIPNPQSNIYLGNIFSDESLPLGSRGGAVLAFPTCQFPDANGHVLLFTVTFIAIVEVMDVIFEFDRRDPPTNPTQNPFMGLYACNGPIFTLFEVESSPSILNGSLIAVEGASWGAVKQMFR